MTKRKKIEEPAEIPSPTNPEIVPERTPDEPVLPEEEPEIIPEKDPDKPSTPPELPKKKKYE